MTFCTGTCNTNVVLNCDITSKFLITTSPPDDSLRKDGRQEGIQFHGENDLTCYCHTSRNAGLITDCRPAGVSGEWRRLHNEELSDLYSSPNIVRVIKSRRMRWAGHVARMGEERVVYRVLVGKLEGKRPLGRPRCRWVDNIRMDLQEVGCGYVGWIGLAQDRDRWRTLVSTVMNLRVP